MIASSPTTAALLRASPNNNTAPRSRRDDGVPSHPSQNNLSAPPISPNTSRPSRSGFDPGFQPGAGDTADPPVRKQMVDAGTQCSCPTALINRTAHFLSTSNSQTDTGPSSTLAQPSQTSSIGGSSAAIMPGIATGSKQNTPGTATVSSKAPPVSDTGLKPDDRDSSEGSLSKRLRAEKPAPKALPRRYEDVDPRDLVILISSMLMELIQYNDQIPLHDGHLTRFHSRSPPRISVTDYLQRLATHATLSPPILLSMVYYIDRLCALYPAFTISSLTVHRFLISAATVASKGLSDSFWTNKTYARVGGITVAELALLELEFLWRVEWRIVPQPEVLVDYYRSLVERCDEYVLEPEAEGGSESQDKPCQAGCTRDVRPE